MKIKTETSTIIAAMTIDQFQFALKGKKKGLLEELISNRESLLNEIKCNCLIETNLPVATVLSKLMGGVSVIVKKYVGNLTSAERAQLMRLLEINLNKQLYIIIDEEYSELEI